MSKISGASFWLGANGTLAIVNLLLSISEPWCLLFAFICALSAWSQWGRLQREQS